MFTFYFPSLINKIDLKGYGSGEKGMKEGPIGSKAPCVFCKSRTLSRMLILFVYDYVCL